MSLHTSACRSYLTKHIRATPDKYRQDSAKTDSMQQHSTCAPILTDWLCGQFLVNARHRSCDLLPALNTWQTLRISVT